MHEKLIFLVGLFVKARIGKLLGICGTLSYQGHGEWRILNTDSQDVYMIFHESDVKNIDEYTIDLEFKNV